MIRSPCRPDKSGKCAGGVKPGTRCRKGCALLDVFARSFNQADTIRPAVDPSDEGYCFLWG